jgi:DNA-binding MarR family transcriptional regulator
MQVGNLMKVLNLFRQKEEDIPIGTILAFLYLMDRDSYFNLGKSRASRNMRNLTDRARPGKAGIGVASYEPDPNDFRVAIFKLNDEGEQLAQEIRDLLKASGLRTET